MAERWISGAIVVTMAERWISGAIVVLGVAASVYILFGGASQRPRATRYEDRYENAPIRVRQPRQQPYARTVEETEEERIRTANGIRSRTPPLCMAVSRRGNPCTQPPRLGVWRVYLTCDFRSHRAQERAIERNRLVTG